MKNAFILFISIVIVSLLLAFMFAFQVRYDEVVVLTTFDKAAPPTEPIRDPATGDDDARRLLIDNPKRVIGLE